MAEAAARVARHYDFAQSQKAMDWAALGMVCASTYAPRLMVIAAQQRMARPARPQQGPIPVAPLNGAEPGFTNYPIAEFTEH